MKKVLLALIAVIFISSLCFAEEPSARADEVKTFVGTIEDFRLAPMQFKSGPPLWPCGLLIVASDNGEKSNFLIVGSGQHATLFYEANCKESTGVDNKKIAKGKKVEVKYAITAETMGYANKQLALSVRDVPADYTLQPTVSPTQTNAIASSKADETKIFIGTVKNVSAVLGREPNWTYNRIDVTADNGDKTDFFVMRSTVITDVDGKDLSGKRIKKGERVEIKYSLLTDSSTMINGQKGAISMRYVPADYVQQQEASSVPSETAQPIQERADQMGNIFTGKIESFRPTFARPPKWPIARFTAVADNGEKMECYVLRDATTVTDVDGKLINNKRPQVGKKVEVKYSIGEHEIYGGKRYEAILIRYLD